LCRRRREEEEGRIFTTEYTEFHGGEREIKEERRNKGMKGNKHQATRRVAVARRAAIGVVLAAIICFALIGCSDGGSSPPNDDKVVRERSATINLFEGKTATVTGVFDKAGLVSAAGKIENAIKTTFNLTSQAPEEAKEMLRNKYRMCEFIIVEKTSDYNNWKTNGDGRTIYINFNILNDDQLRVRIGNAIESMSTNGSKIDEIVKAIQPKHQCQALIL
jgi:hypothetical protein